MANRDRREPRSSEGRHPEKGRVDGVHHVEHAHTQFAGLEHGFNEDGVRDAGEFEGFAVGPHNASTGELRHRCERGQTANGSSSAPFMAVEPPFWKDRIPRLSGECALRFPRRGWMDGRSPLRKTPASSRPAGAHVQPPTAQLPAKSSNSPGWNGSNARCSSRKKSAFVLPARFPFNVWQSNA